MCCRWMSETSGSTRSIAHRWAATFDAGAAPDKWGSSPPFGDTGRTVLEPAAVCSGRPALPASWFGLGDPCHRRGRRIRSWREFLEKTPESTERHLEFVLWRSSRLLATGQPGWRLRGNQTYLRAADGISTARTDGLPGQASAASRWAERWRRRPAGRPGAKKPKKAPPNRAHAGLAPDSRPGQPL